jgi:Peptidase family M50
MRKAVRLLLHGLSVVVIAAVTVTGLFAAAVVAGMVIACLQDGRFVGSDKPILGKAAAVLLASSLILGLTGWIYRRFAREGDATCRVVPSRTGRPERATNAVFEIVFFVALATWLWTMISPGPFRIPLLVGWITAGFVAIHVHVFLHESGHLLLGWALGFRLRALHVGTGPLLYASAGRAQVRLVWRVWPLCGFAFATDPKGRSPRLRQSLFVAGGPLMDAAILFAGYRLIVQGCGSLGEAWTHSAGTFVAAALLMRVGVAALSGLVPHKAWIDGRSVRTDGALLLQTWLAPKGVVGFTGDPSWNDALQWLPPISETTKRSLLPEFETPGATFREVQSRLQGPLRR